MLDKFPHEQYISDNDIELAQIPAEIKKDMNAFKMQVGRFKKSPDPGKAKASLTPMSEKIKAKLETWYKEYEDEEEEQAAEPAKEPEPEPKKADEPAAEPAKKEPEPEPKKEPAEPAKEPEPESKKAEPQKELTGKAKKIAILEEFLGAGITEVSKEELRAKGYPTGFLSNLETTGEKINDQYILVKQIRETKYKIVKK